MTATLTRLSTLFLRTLREAPADEDITSAQLLIRAGYIRKEAPGIFAWLPLGLRTLSKIETIIREEMDRIGSQEVHFPALLPREPYEMTHRWEEYGDNIFKLKDRHSSDYLLAPTHEEMFTLLVKNMYSSYKDLPVTLYQIQTKYRDEARPRAGLIRGREFIMEDSYSFSLSEEGLKEEYERERGAYERVFKRLGIKYIMVHAFSGAMGGSESEEFLAPLPIGEDTFAQSLSGKAWNVEALVTPPLPEQDYSHVPLPSEVSTPDAHTIEGLVECLNSSYSRSDRSWQASDILKNVVLTVTQPDGSKSLAVIALPGDREVDLKRVEAHLSPAEVAPATPEELRQHPELVTGFIGVSCIGPQSAVSEENDAIPYLIDAHIAKGSSWVTGADKKDAHLQNVVYGRDFEGTATIEASQIREGDISPDGSGPLSFERGVEIGQIFQLGLKYSKALDLTVLDENGKSTPVWMGSYGIGVSRCLACIVEFHHDDKGIQWPISVAPAQVHIVIAGKSEEASHKAESLAHTLQKENIDVIIDDRTQVSPGVKFNDAELLGMPLIVVVGRDYVDNHQIEIRIRSTGEKYLIDAAEIENAILSEIDKLKEE